jgi:DNA-binding transcriptional ArsR family regulator
MAKKARPKAIDPVAAFKLLADANRCRAREQLARARAGMLVGEIAEALSMEHSATSHLLGLLSESDAVSYEKEGRSVRYRLGKSPMAKLLLKLLRAA